MYPDPKRTRIPYRHLQLIAYHHVLGPSLVHFLSQKKTFSLSQMSFVKNEASLLFPCQKQLCYPPYCHTFTKIFVSQRNCFDHFARLHINSPQARSSTIKSCSLIHYTIFNFQALCKSCSIVFDLSSQIPTQMYRSRPLLLFLLLLLRLRFSS